MRRFVYVIVVLAFAGVAAAEPDPHAEMAAALVEQADLHPATAALPGTIAATKVAATPAAKHVPPQANLGRAAAAAGSQGQLQGPSPTALAHQAAAAAASAAGQTQAAAAKARHNPKR